MAEKEETLKKPQKRKIFKILLIILLVILFFCFFFYEIVVYTPDAFVRANWIEISPRVEGHIKAVHVLNNQFVKANTVLAEIEEYPYQLILNVRKATLAQNQAELKVIQVKFDIAKETLKNYQDEYKMMQAKVARYEKLSKDGAVSVDQYQTVRKKYDITKTKLIEAQENCRYWQAMVNEQITVIDASSARVALAQYHLDMCKIRTPAAGYVTNMYVRPGNFANKGKPMFGITESDEWWVEANYKECFVGKIKPGQKVWLQCDLYPFRIFSGEVVNTCSAVSRREVPQTTLPYIEPTIDWIRLQYRFPVRIKIINLPKDVKLRMGADVRSLIFVHSK